MEAHKESRHIHEHILEPLSRILSIDNDDEVDDDVDLDDSQNV